MSQIIARVLTALMLLLAPAARAADPGDAARRILAKNQDAVLTVKFVFNMKMTFLGQNEKQESKSEIIGTVVDPAGLLVVSLSAMDPAILMNHYMTSMGGGAGEMKFEFETELVSLTVLLPDGRELNATVALRDKDLDVAYIRITDKLPVPLRAVSLDSRAKPAVLDPVVCLGRLGSVAGRGASVVLERIGAVVEKPRLFYVIGQGFSTTAPGSPVFSADGKLLGIVVQRTAPTKSNVANWVGSANAAMMNIIIPAAEIAEGLKQAREATESPR
jgi:hypothetical protein